MKAPDNILGKVLGKFAILWDFDMADPRSKRKRLIALAAVYTGLARVVSIMANLAQVPIALHYLKAEAFGLWMTLVGGVQLMSFADLGMGLGLQNKISEAYGRDDLQSIRNLYKTGWLILGWVGCGIAFVGLPLCWLIPWAHIFKINDPLLRSDVPGALAVILAFFCAGLPLNAGVRLSVGIQLGWVSGVWNAVSSVFCLGLIMLGRHFGAGFIVFVALAMSAPVIGNIGIIAQTFHILGKKFSGLAGRYERGLPRSLLRQGVLFLVPQMSALVMNSAPAVIIASVLGTTLVTPFNICQRLTNALSQIQQLPLTGLWPAYAEAKSRGDNDWVWKTFLKSFYYSATTAIIFALGTIFAGRMIVSKWTNGAVILNSELLIGFGILLAMLTTMSSIAFLLNGCGVLYGQALGGALTSVLLLCLIPIMVKHIGLKGAVFAMIVSYLSVGVIPVLLSLAKLKTKLKLGGQAIS